MLSTNDSIVVFTITFSPNRPIENLFEPITILGMNSFHQQWTERRLQVRLNFCPCHELSLGTAPLRPYFDHCFPALSLALSWARSAYNWACSKEIAACEASNSSSANRLAVNTEETKVCSR